ncbi:hypothetical protein K8I61_14640 [bacterium]|nr:hypothetical protein [bacterium]
MTILALVGAAAFAFAVGCGKKDTPPAAPSPDASPAKTPSAVKYTLKKAPAAPYTVEDADEKEISLASDLPQELTIGHDASERMLLEYQVKLAECEEQLEKKDDMCQARQATLYMLLVGDRYAEQGKYDDALAFYLKAVKRTLSENEKLAAEYEARKGEPTPAGQSDTGKAMHGAYFGARYHFQSYKDYAEIARYQKRIVGIMAAAGNPNVEDQWPFVRESIRASAEHKRAFLDHWNTLKSINEKIPDAYREFYEEVARLADSMKIEAI